MKPSKENPVYSVYVTINNVKYDLTPALISLDLSEQENQLAQSATIDLFNTLVDGKYLTGLLTVRNRVTIYANDGERSDEVFRGFIWARPYTSGLEDRELTLKCYDHLIYLQESEEAQYFSAGKSSKDVVSSLCSKWGVKLDWSYSTITHSKMALRGPLSDIIMSDVLDLVKDRTGAKYVIRSEKDVMKVMGVGQNSTVYSFKSKENAIQTRSESTMDGMITKVVILGKADDDGRQPVEATVDGDTSTYGTLQKIISRNENTALADAKKEAEGILKESGQPFWEWQVRAPDIPWIRKGDKVYVNAGDIYDSNLIVASVSHTISSTKKEITMTLKRP